ncbi:Uncharacterised protein [Legionella feeleii]|uniref:Uncharacterized protein n=1 Tax=Legionella feeleii TaxID=453 RepID=A0A378IUI9_9GAMM|nr:Uncharacterised protein [Legionella feeleii]
MVDLEIVSFLSLIFLTHFKDSDHIKAITWIAT